MNKSNVIEGPWRREPEFDERKGPWCARCGRSCSWEEDHWECDAHEEFCKMEPIEGRESVVRGDVEWTKGEAS